MSKFFSWLDKAEKVVCGAGFILLIALVFLSAILRFFRVSVSWNIDMAMLMLAWTAFLGADIAWRSGQIIGVNLLTRNLPAKLQLVIDLLINLVILVTLAMMCIYTLRLAWAERIARFQSMSIPYSLVTLSLAVASFSMILSTGFKIRTNILNLVADGKKSPGGGLSRDNAGSAEPGQQPQGRVDK